MLTHDILTPFIEPLEKNRILYFVTGSIATIFYGEPRLTHDVDIVLHLDSADISSFARLFPQDEFYCPPREIIQIEAKRRPYGHFNLIHHVSGFKADVYADAGDPLHKWAFIHRNHAELTKALKIWLAPPEYIIIRKLEYFREGGSQKHLEDIAKMLPMVQSELKTGFLHSEIAGRGLKAIWAKVRQI